MFSWFTNTVAFFDGKKTMLAALGTALVGTGTIAANASEKGVGYLLYVASTPEFAAASIGWIGFFNALKGEKIRAEIAGVKEDTSNVAVASGVTPAPSESTVPKGGTK